MSQSLRQYLLGHSVLIPPTSNIPAHHALAASPVTSGSLHQGTVAVSVSSHGNHTDKTMVDFSLHLPCGRFVLPESSRKLVVSLKVISMYEHEGYER